MRWNRTPKRNGAGSKIGEDQVFYFNQRGISTEDAVSMIVNGGDKLPPSSIGSAAGRPDCLFSPLHNALLNEKVAVSPDEHRKLRHARVKEILYEASELEPDARREFLERACGGDPELSREVESLLSYFDGRAGEGELQTAERGAPEAGSAAESGPANADVTSLPAQKKDSAGLAEKRKSSG